MMFGVGDGMVNMPRPDRHAFAESDKAGTGSTISTIRPPSGALEALTTP
jgi:hypothetical protein